MKCPQCNSNQKYAEGMICKICGYRFALNPKESPYITDMAFKNAVDRVSGNGQYYFTYNQLFAQIYRLLKKKQRQGTTGCLIGFFIIMTAVFFTNAGSFFAKGLFFTIFIFLIWGIIWFQTRSISYSKVAGIISKYRKVRSIDRLIDGRNLFEYNLNSKELGDEILQYAPERILIVERNDIANMLILNRFHIEQKTLVVSDQKYPERAFTACQRFLLQHSDIPVVLMHDASEEGLHMKDRLLTDKAWNLEGKNIQDLGLFPKDTDRLKHSMWLPTMPKRGKEKILSNKKMSYKNIQKGYKMPLDIAPPRTVMGVTGLAMATGLALLSDELLAEQQSHSGIGAGRGFG